MAASRLGAALAAGVTIVLSGCGSSETTAAPTKAPTKAPTPAPAPTPLQKAIDDRIALFAAKDTTKLDKFADGVDQYYTIAVHGNPELKQFQSSSTVPTRYGYYVLNDGKWPGDPEIIDTHPLSDDADEKQAFMIWRWGTEEEGILVSVETLTWDDKYEEITRHAVFAEKEDDRRRLKAATRAPEQDPCQGKDSMNALICDIQGDDMDKIMAHFADNAEMLLFDELVEPLKIEKGDKARIKTFFTTNKADGAEERLSGTNFAHHSHFFPDRQFSVATLWEQTSGDWHYRFHVEFDKDGTTDKTAKVKRMQVLKCMEARRTQIV